MVGGFASQLHGARRQTYDIDFVPAATGANDDRLESALRELGAVFESQVCRRRARQLLGTIDAATLRAFGSTTWTTDAGPLEVTVNVQRCGAARSTTDSAVD